MDIICKVGLGTSDCKQFENKFTQLVVRILDDIEDVLFCASWILPCFGNVFRIIQLGGAVLGKWEVSATFAPPAF